MGSVRISRAFARESFDNPEIELVAVNDLGSLENLAYLLKYDTVYKRAPFSVDFKESQGATLVVNGKEVKFYSEKDPAMLPWKELSVDVVVESTGFFTDYEKAQAHITAGARRVVISAPVKGREDGGADSAPTVLMGIDPKEKRRSLPRAR